MQHPSIQFTYTQLALTQDTDKDTYSHLPAYPPHTQYFIEPKGVAAAVKCRVRVLNSEGKEMTFIRVVPFSPSRGENELQIKHAGAMVAVGEVPKILLDR